MACYVLCPRAEFFSSTLKKFDVLPRVLWVGSILVLFSVSKRHGALSKVGCVSQSHFWSRWPSLSPPSNQHLHVQDLRIFLPTIPCHPPAKIWETLSYVQLDISFSKSALNPEQKCPNITSTVFGQCLATNIVLVWPSQRPNRRLNILDGWKVGQSFLSMFLHQASSSLCLPPLQGSPTTTCLTTCGLTSFPQPSHLTDIVQLLCHIVLLCEASC